MGWLLRIYLRKKRNLSSCLYLLLLSRLIVCFSCFLQGAGVELRMSIGAGVNSRLHIIALWRAAAHHATIPVVNTNWKQFVLQEKKMLGPFLLRFNDLKSPLIKSTATKQTMQVSSAASHFEIISCIFPSFRGFALGLVSRAIQKKPPKNNTTFDISNVNSHLIVNTLNPGQVCRSQAQFQGERRESPGEAPCCLLFSPTPKMKAPLCCLSRLRKWTPQKSEGAPAAR